MRYRATHHTNHVLDTPFGEVEIQYAADMADWGGALAHREGDKLVVAYLSHDDDPGMHPLDDCDGMGYIVGRGKYEMRGHSESELFEALGLDLNGDTNYELVQDLVDAAWGAYVEGLSDEVWLKFTDALGFPSDGENRNEYINKWRDELASYSAFYEGDTGYLVLRADDYVSWDFNPNKDQLAEAVACLDFDVEKVTHDIFMAEAEAGRIGNPCAVMLDVYEHGGVAWSLSGHGTQCRWDTSRGAGIWLPDDDARAEIERRAPVYATAYIRQTPLRMHGKDNKYQLVDTVTDTSIALSDNWGDLWAMAKKHAEAAGDLTSDQVQLGRYRASQELAAQAVETYNSWANGDVYGCTVEHFTLVSEDDVDIKWEQYDEDSCWGFIGSDYAKDALINEFFEPAVKALQNATVTAE